MTGTNFSFNASLADGYKSSPQKIRVISEAWVAENVFCPSCGYSHISSLPNNSPVADFVCENCGLTFELKSKNGIIGKKITDGAYSTMIERITSTNNPDLFVMQYSNDLQVINLTLVPRFFFIPSIIEKRKPLSNNARRAGWTGCNILFSDIPTQGRIKIIENQVFSDVDSVVGKYQQVKKIATQNVESRSWLLDVLSCVNRIPTTDFTLKEVYEFVDELRLKHCDNHNIEAKIRQQLQILRDKGFIEFLDRGYYRKII